MLNLLKRVLVRLRALLGLGGSDGVSETLIKRPRKAKEHFGSHYYLGDLLDTLDDCFKVYSVFRKADPEGYRLFCRVGAHVSSSDGNVEWSRLDSYLVSKTLPAFACVHHPAKYSSNDRLIPCFVSARKQHRPVNVELSNSDVYEITMVYRDRKRSQLHVAGSFNVAVTPGSDIRVLRRQEPVYRAFGRRGRGVVRMEWRLPTWLEDIGTGEGDESTPTEKARAIFITLMNRYYTGTESGITVRVYKGREVATFAIDMLRTPYFFADRDKTVNENGRSKRIFHIVRTHRRANGKYIKSHFRGLREFDWNGYRVKISVPHKHRSMLSGFGIKSYDARDLPTGENGVASDELGDLLDARMDLETR